MPAPLDAVARDLPVRPLLRGILHEAGFYVAVPAGVVLVATAEGGLPRAVAAVFAVSVVAMFGASALYHRGRWSPARRRWLRRLDHAGVYGLIAGTYTPVGVLVLHGSWRIGVLATVWTGALAGVGLRLVWIAAPEWLSALVGIALGWVGVAVLPQLLHALGPGPSSLLVAGGLCYTLGAVVYARRRPDPVPAVFGYHELFHAFTLAAVSLQYAAIAFYVLPRG
jgi:hemolysin III